MSIEGSKETGDSVPCLRGSERSISLESSIKAGDLVPVSNAVSEIAATKGKIEPESKIPDSRSNSIKAEPCNAT